MAPAISLMDDMNWKPCNVLSDDEFFEEENVQKVHISLTKPTVAYSRKEVIS